MDNINLNQRQDHEALHEESAIHPAVRMQRLIDSARLSPEVVQNVLDSLARGLKQRDEERARDKLHGLVVDGSQPPID